VAERSRRSERSAGFTLIEVIAAVLMVGLVFGVLISWVTTNLRAVERSRRENEASQLAEQRARELQFELLQGAVPDDGTDRGEFAPAAGAADAEPEYGWEVTVEPYQIPLPPDSEGVEPASALFVSPGAPGISEDSPLKRLSIRVYALDRDDEDLVEPFVLFGVQPTAPGGNAPQAGGAADAGAAGSDAAGRGGPARTPADNPVDPEAP
jgi:type II secretory pathway pseudopilin PulG